MRRIHQSNRIIHILKYMQITSRIYLLLLGMCLVLLSQQSGMKGGVQML